LFAIPNYRTLVLSNRIQEFGKVARPGKREKPIFTTTYVEKERENNSKIILSINFCFSKYL